MEQRHGGVDVSKDQQPQFHKHLHRHGVPEGHHIIVGLIPQQLLQGGQGIGGQHPGIPGKKQIGQIDGSHSQKRPPEHPSRVLPPGDPGLPGNPGVHPQHNGIANTHAARQAQHPVQQIFQHAQRLKQFIVSQNHRQRKQGRKPKQPLFVTLGTFPGIAELLPHAKHPRQATEQINTVIGIGRGQRRQGRQPGKCQQERYNQLPFCPQFPSHLPSSQEVFYFCLYYNEKYFPTQEKRVKLTLDSFYRIVIAYLPGGIKRGIQKNADYFSILDCSAAITSSCFSAGSVTGAGSGEKAVTVRRNGSVRKNG